MVLPVNEAGIADPEVAQVAEPASACVDAPLAT